MVCEAASDALAPQLLAQCANCETSAVMAGGHLPAGWVELADSSVPSGKSALCPDCAPPAFVIRNGDAGGSYYGGCRIHHEIMLGAAGLRIHGGAEPRRGGRDEPVQFLLNLDGLDQLISHLQHIRGQLAASPDKEEA